MTTPYLGNKISLISKLDIRYEGILYQVDSHASTIALAKVRSFGTEDRPTAHPVPAREESYEIIIFKASDIKDLIVCGDPKPPSPPPMSGLPYDPAIVSVTAVPPPPLVQAPKAVPPPSMQQQGWQSRPQPQPGAFQPVGSYAQRSAGDGGTGATRQQLADSTRGGFGRSRRGQSGPEAQQQAPRQPQPPPPRAQQPEVGTRAQGLAPSSGGGNSHYSQPQHYRHQYNRQQDNNGAARPHPHQRNAAPLNSTHHHHHQQAPAKQFQADYDFEKANEHFQEQLSGVTSDLANIGMDGDGKEEAAPTAADNFSTSGRSSITNGDSAHNDGSFYDKNASFFDSISCEALEREEGRNNRPDWKKERMTNQETFGHSMVRSLAYRRGGRGGRYQQPHRYGQGGREGGGQGGYYGQNSRGGGGGGGGASYASYGRQRQQAEEK